MGIHPLQAATEILHLLGLTEGYCQSTRTRSRSAGPSPRSPTAGRLLQPARYWGKAAWTTDPVPLPNGGASVCHIPDFSRSGDGPTTQTLYTTGTSKTPARSPSGLLRFISRAVFHQTLLKRGTPPYREEILHSMTLPIVAVLLWNSSPACPQPFLRRRDIFGVHEDGASMLASRRGLADLAVHKLLL